MAEIPPLGPTAPTNDGKDFAENIAKAAGSMEKVDKHVKSIATSIERSSRTFKTISTQSKETADNMKVVNDGLEKAAKINDRLGRGFAEAFQRISKGFSGLAADLDKMRVQANIFGSEWQSSVGRGIKGFEEIRKEAQSSAIELRRLAQQGKTTYEELQGLSKQAAHSGVNFGEFREKLLKGGDALKLVNQGYFELKEMSDIAMVGINQLGQTTDDVNKTLLNTALATDKINNTFGKTILSSHQLAQQIQVLQTGFKYLGVDAERLPGVLAAFASSAESARQKGRWSPTGAVMNEVGGRMVSDMAAFDVDKTAFFGQMGGMGSGLSAGVEFEEMMRKGNVGEAAGSILKTVEGLSGQGFVSGDDVMRAKRSGNAGEAERLASLREQQIGILQETTGRSREDARALVEAGSGGQGSLAASLQKGGSPETDPMFVLQRRMAKDAESTAEATQTVATELEKFIAVYKQTAASFEETVRKAAMVGIALDYLSNLPLILEAIKGLGGPILGAISSALGGLAGGIGAKLFGTAAATTAASTATAATAAGTTSTAASALSKGSRLIRAGGAAALPVMIAAGVVSQQVHSDADSDLGEGSEANIKQIMSGKRQLRQGFIARAANIIGTGDASAPDQQQEYRIQELLGNMRTTLPKDMKNRDLEIGKIEQLAWSSPDKVPEALKALYPAQAKQLEDEKKKRDEQSARENMQRYQMMGMGGAFMMPTINTATSASAAEKEQAATQTKSDLTAGLGDHLKNLQVGGALNLEVALTKAVSEKINIAIKDGLVAPGPMAMST